MEALFTNPLTMIAGAALVSAPILIHLINRMRFRRIKWAAMEFLLKAQKRMRRKLIIEQLILLFLRCLMVFLLGLLFARFLGYGKQQGQESRATAHLVILDDTPSTGDFWTDAGQVTNAFEQAKVQIGEKIAPAAAQANTPQYLELLRLSDLATPRNFERINSSSIDELKTYLAPLRPASVRVSLVDGLRKAKALLDARSDKDVAKVIHVVSDLRAVDWAADGDAIRQLVDEYTRAGLQIHLIDVSFPYRRDTDRQPRSSDNMAIVEFRPLARVAAEDRAVDFIVRVRNFGNTEVPDARIEVFVNGQRRDDATARFQNIPPGQERTQLIPIQVSRTGTADKPLDRFNSVVALLRTTENGGLEADNIRYAVIECRKKLSVLVVEGRPQLRNDPKGDEFYLKKLFLDSFGGINWEDGSPRDLETKDLRQYSSVYLLNVPTLTETQAKALEGYVRGGGGVGVFLGPDVRPQDYNKVLYNDGAGFFPVPLPEKPTDVPTDEQKLKRFLVLSKRILLRDAAVKTHPALAGLYTTERGVAAKEVDVEKFFYFLSVDQYWPVKRLGKWLQDSSVQELYCLPNEDSVFDHQEATEQLVRELRTLASEPKFEKYRKYIDPLVQNIRNTFGGNPAPPLTVLAIYFDRLLCDQINDGDESEPLLREFWSSPEATDLKAKFQRRRDMIKYGDPLYIARQFGQGRVAVMTTTANDQWTDWPSQKGSPGWVAVVKELQGYLTGGGSEENRAVGSVVEATLAATQYQPTVTRTFSSVDPTPALKGNEGKIPVTLTELGEQPLEVKDPTLLFRFAEARKPGVYMFSFTPVTERKKDAAMSGADASDFTAFAFNIDAQREGDLRRVSRDDLSQQAPNVGVHSPDDTSWLENLKQKQDDLSTRRWIYLMIVLVLLAEAAMAVRLSYHTRDENLEAFAPSAAATYSRGAAPPPAEAVAEEPAGV